MPLIVYLLNKQTEAEDVPSLRGDLIRGSVNIGSAATARFCCAKGAIRKEAANDCSVFLGGIGKLATREEDCTRVGGGGNNQLSGLVSENLNKYRGFLRFRPVQSSSKPRFLALKP